METFFYPVSAPRSFGDRREAGRLLALGLIEGGVLGADTDGCLVVGLARGGVVVAAEVAAVLHTPLDALAVRKVGHPSQPEYGIGAVAPGGVEYVRASDGLTEAEVEGAVRAAAAKAAALDAIMHERYAPLPVLGTTCVLVDDGLATGVTMVAAVHWARAGGAKRVVVAVPVGAAQTVAELERDELLDRVVCLSRPFELGAVGVWYDDFDQVSDEDVVGLLATSRERALDASHAEIVVGDRRLPADLTVPAEPVGWVVFAHGSGSSRLSPRNVSVAASLNRAGIATLLFDLLTPEEEADRQNVFDVDLLASRLRLATAWLSARPEAAGLPIAYFGASTGAAAALVAAADLGERIAAVVSRGGRPDLARDRLADVRAPTLLVVGGADEAVLELNRAATERLTCPHELAIVPDASHLFEEPGALEQVAALAIAWLRRHLAPTRNLQKTEGGVMADATPLGMSEQERREALSEELGLAFRTEQNTATIHGIAHSVARVIALDHLRITEQLERAGIRIHDESRAR